MGYTKQNVSVFSVLHGLLYAPPSMAANLPFLPGSPVFAGSSLPSSCLSISRVSAQLLYRVMPSGQNSCRLLAHSLLILTLLHRSLIPAPFGGRYPQQRSAFYTALLLKSPALTGAGALSGDRFLNFLGGVSTFLLRRFSPPHRKLKKRKPLTKRHGLPFLAERKSAPFPASRRGPQSRGRCPLRNPRAGPLACGAAFS